MENECREDGLQNAKHRLPDCFFIYESCCLSVGADIIRPQATVQTTILIQIL